VVIHERKGVKTEPTNIMYKKDRVLICGLAYILLLGQGFSGACAEELQLPKDLKVKVSEHFRFFGPGDDIDWQALHDPNNNPILVACLKGSPDESLRDLGIHDLQQRLDRLERGNFIRKANGRYRLAFPTVVGDKRDRLREYAEQVARELVPLGEKIIADIRPHLAGRDEMLYHVLLSAIIGEHLAWSSAWAEMTKQVKSGDTSFGRKAWLVYPPHPFQAAPNNYGSPSWHLRITWNHNTPSPDVIRSVISQYAGQLTKAIEQNSAVASIEARNALGKYGLVDEGGKVRFYAIRRDSEAAKVYANLARQYGQQLMNHLDVAKVADMLDVSPGLALVITGGEIRCQLLQNLAEKRFLEVPRILAKSGIEVSEAYQLVSLKIIPRVEYLQNRISAKSRMATTLILVLGLAGLIGAIVLFFVKSSIGT